jgi:hypothetical protein
MEDKNRNKDQEQETENHNKYCKWWYDYINNHFEWLFSKCINEKTDLID